MTNSVNVQAVCDKLLQHLISSNDSFYRQDLIHKSLKIVQKYPFNTGYIFYVQCDVSVNIHLNIRCRIPISMIIEYIIK